jgi:hypothetical protein
VYFGRSVAGPGDVDGDGAPDVAVRIFDYGATAAGGYDVYSGADASLIRVVRDAGSSAFAMAAIGDLDGDGAEDIAVGNPSYMTFLIATARSVPPAVARCSRRPARRQSARRTRSS